MFIFVALMSMLRMYDSDQILRTNSIKICVDFL